MKIDKENVIVIEKKGKYYLLDKKTRRSLLDSSGFIGTCRDIKDILFDNIGADKEEVERAKTWLDYCRQSPKINKKYTTYNLKHAAERWWSKLNRERGVVEETYVSNNALIIAAIEKGFTVQFGSLEHSGYINFKVEEEHFCHL